MSVLSLNNPPDDCLILTFQLFQFRGNDNVHRNALHVVDLCLRIPAISPLVATVRAARNWFLTAFAKDYL